ncbi:sensor histidine kinase [Brachybacterium hainanense]|uniref:histidine kinase n=1 Tax=Brachybacterium hainanense TaxID=1541174 RepID=A0ABV6RFK7_9MICO
MSPLRASAPVTERLADAGLGLALALVLAVVVAAGSPHRSTGAVIAALLACTGLGALLLARRHAPVAVLLVTVAGIFAYYIADLPPLGMVLPATGALFSAAEQGRTRWAMGAALGLLAVASYFRLAVPDPADVVSGYGYVSELALAAAAIALGAVVRLAREARSREAADRVRAERLQIARDLHDSIGHALAVSSLHAGVASDALSGSAAPPATREALEQVRASTSLALAELRSTVRVLRGTAETGPEPPSLQRVVDDARAAGLQIAVRPSGLLAEGAGALPGGLDVTVRRLVQESLTNVLRHARASRVLIELAPDAEGLVLRICDDGAGRPSARADEGRAGAGIVGMRERVALLGGVLEARPGPDGFVVEARLPRPADGAGR